MKRILVCDDSDFVRKLIKRELESAYDLEIFKDGYEAYKFLKEDKDFDFAIIDGEMPKMDGWELIKKIKGELGLQELPTIILTASDDEYFKRDAFSHGVFDYIRKPFQSGDLYEYLRKFFLGKINRGTVLVVEDSKLQNQAISQQLKYKHIKPISAFSGEEAIRLLIGGAKIDAILLDLHLKGASGFQIAEALKKDSRFGYIPIIGITAASDQYRLEMMEKAFENGVDDFISKPYEIVEFFARIMSSIKRGKLVRKLKEESELDYLTKIYNRRTFFRILNHLFSSAIRYKSPMSFLMLDIDHFKKVNDTYGHFAGDEVLKSIAKTIDKSIRKADVLGRFGGEEFCVVMPQTDIESACIVADKVRKDIENKPIIIDDSSINIQVSAGVSSLSWEDRIDAFIKKADNALYNAKELGRNRVCYYDKDGNIKQYKP